MDKFIAGVQYGDFKGSAAADRADMKDVSIWLSENKHIASDEYLIGISMRVGENRGSQDTSVSVMFLVAELNGYKNIPEMIQASGDSLQVKEVEVDMNISDFFALFKRFEITLSSKGLFEGKNFTAISK